MISRSTIRSSGASSPTDSSSILPTVLAIDRAKVGDARRGHRLAEPDRAAEGGRLEDLGVRDRDPDADPGALADLGRASGEMGQLGEELLHERRDRDRRLAVAAANRCFSWRTIASSWSSVRG